MSRVKSKDTTPEIKVRSALHRRGLRFRKNVSNLPGKPDVVFTKAKVAVFIDGDFWHGRNLENQLAQGNFAGNRDFWITKLRQNIERDKQVEAQLRDDGWTILRVWESDTKKNLDAEVDRICATVVAANHSS